MAYVEAHAGLRDHLKTKKVARLLGVPKVQVIGHLLCLWWWCQEYAQDGDLSSFDAADIAEAAEWEGDPQTFVNALLGCGVKGGAGFLHHDDDTGALLINDWYQYGGKLFVQRAQSAERMRNYRARKANEQDSYADVTRNDTVTVTHVTPIDKIRIDNTTNVPADAGSADAERAPALPSDSLAEQFHVYVEQLKDPNANRPAVLHSVYALCFGKNAAPDYGYLGKAAKQVGGAGRLAQLMFELVPRPPAGDVLAYIVAEEAARKKRAATMGGNREISEVQFATNGGDIYG